MVQENARQAGSDVAKVQWTSSTLPFKVYFTISESFSNKKLPSSSTQVSSNYLNSILGFEQAPPSIFNLLSVFKLFKFGRSVWCELWSLICWAGQRRRKVLTWGEASPFDPNNWAIGRCCNRRSQHFKIFQNRGYFSPSCQRLSKSSGFWMKLGSPFIAIHILNKHIHVKENEQRL